MGPLAQSHESIRATRAHRDSACAPNKPRPARCQGMPQHRSRSSCSRGLLPPSPPAEKATDFRIEDRPQLSVALRMLRLRTIYRSENIGNVLKRVVNVCQREFVNEVLRPLITEFVCNFGRENARPIQHAFNGGLLDSM